MAVYFRRPERARAPQPAESRSLSSGTRRRERAAEERRVVSWRRDSMPVARLHSLCYRPGRPVIIESRSCHARYKHDEDRFERKPSNRTKRAKRGSVLEIHNAAFAEKKATAVERTAARRADGT